MMVKVCKEEVMLHLDKEILKSIDVYLKPIETIWQPADMLPQSHEPGFIDDIKLLQQRAGDLSYDLIAVLIGDTITEEALPTYETWLSDIRLMDEEQQGGWNRWVRGWTAEENRHGDLLNRYLFLSGRVNMKAMEISTQYLLADGFDPGTARDPYRSFIYTSFQELATNLSHRRVATFAKAAGDEVLAKICGNIASDEARHANAYKSFVTKIFGLDPNEMMLAFEHMMRTKILMPAYLLREKGEPKGNAFQHFSEAAQRIGVYTTVDYINILKLLIKEWKIPGLRNLTEQGERARDYIMNLPARLTKLTERSISNVQNVGHKFSWIFPQH